MRSRTATSIRVVLAAAAALVLVTAPAQLRAASTCPINIDFAEITAIGSAHGYAEYLIVLTAKSKTGQNVDQASLGSPMSIRLLAGADPAPADPVDVAGATFGLTDVTDLPGDVILVVLPTHDFRWFSVHSVEEDGASIACSDSPRYILPTPLASTTSTFDDAAGWVKLGQPASITLDGPHFVKMGKADFSLLDVGGYAQHDVAIAAIVNADGSLGDASVYRSSGNSAADSSALSAVRHGVFMPAQLPVSVGKGLIRMRILVLISLSLSDD